MKTSDYHLNVFINCPFDNDYSPIMEAIIFAIHDCGFVARSALELNDSGEVRIEKISRIVGECRFGVHDICRVELDEAHCLPRFNMPFELGLFIGARRFGSALDQQKISLILDSEKYRYQKYCSDIAGQDIQSHGHSPEIVVRIIRNWLRSTSRLPSPLIPGGNIMVARFQAFQSDLPLLCKKLMVERSELIFADYTTIISEWQSRNAW
jgi:hypothetical protein